MFEVRIPLRWSDLDAQGHVNNALLVDYLQEARVAFLRGGPASRLLDDGVVVVRHQVEYRASTDYSTGNDHVDVSLGVTRVGGARFEIGYEVTQQGRTVARARTVLCPFDFTAQQPVRLDTVTRGFLEEHRLEGEDFSELAAPALNGGGTPTPVVVRWSDLDAYGHVNNAQVYDYIQQGRVEATTRWDPTMARAGAADSEHLWLVARQDVDYLAQIPHRLEPYVISTAPVKLGSTSMVLASEIVDASSGTVHARGRTVLVCADLSMRPTALPESVRQRVSPFVVR